MHIKLRTTIKTFEVEIEDDATIGDLKKKLEEQMDESERIAAKDQKFILLGKILKDEMKVSEINLSKGSAIFVAGTKPKAPEEKKSENVQATKPPQNQNSFPQQPYQAYNGSSANMGYPGFGGYQGSMGNMNEQIDLLLKNKDVMDNYINMMCGNATPEQKESMKQMMTQTMERFKNNPEEMNTMLQQAANNPDMMRMFGGNFFNPTAPQPPMSPPGYPQQPPMSPPGYPQPMYPYQQPYFYPGQVQPSPTIPCSHGFYPRTEVDYSEQAKILVEMGYTNDTLNKEALKISNGDISVAVALLIEWMNKN